MAIKTDDIIGHGRVLQLLDRWAADPAFSYLFSGPAHIGKHLIAERLVRGLLDYDLERPLNIHPDVLIFEPEEGKKDVAVKLVRELRSRMYSRPQIAKRIVAYIPFMDRLNEEGFNALLKVMEEPPAGAVFIAVAEQLNRIPATVLSRTVHVRLGIIPRNEMAEGLIKKGLDKNKVQEMSRSAHGKPGMVLGEGHNYEELEALARRFAYAESLGKRYTVIDDMRRVAESAEDPARGWRDVLCTCQQVLSSDLGKNEKNYIILGQGVNDALQSIGGAISPKYFLDAAALNAKLGFVPKPGLKPRKFSLSLETTNKSFLL
ncbi:MAG: hypothetical protein ACOYUZ_00010 [Patescibacteria group bacterium]